MKSCPKVVECPVSRFLVICDMRNPNMMFNSYNCTLSVRYSFLPTILFRLLIGNNLLRWRFLSIILSKIIIASGGFWITWKCYSNSIAKLNQWTVIFLDLCRRKDCQMSEYWIRTNIKHSYCLVMCSMLTNTFPNVNLCLLTICMFYDFI